MDDYRSAVEKAKKAGADGIIVDQENYELLTENLEQLETDFPVIACVPFWLEDEDEERIIKASDGIAVMNYLKMGEREQIETELELCQEYGKPIVTIYELQPPGTYDLRNTTLTTMTVFRPWKITTNRCSQTPQSALRFTRLP